MTRERCDMRPCLVLACLVLGASVGNAAGFAIRGSVIANGGPSSTPATNGTRSVQGTLGQAAVGQSQNGSQQVCSGFWCFGGARVVAVLPGAGMPARLALGPATPNPARNRATFRLALPEAAQVTLKVYDLAGRQMARRCRAISKPGSTSWCGGPRLCSRACTSFGSGPTGSSEPGERSFWCDSGRELAGSTCSATSNGAVSRATLTP